MTKRDIVVIGGSAGSQAVLRRIMADLEPGFPASVFVVTHIHSRSSGYLPEILDRSGPLPVSAAVDGAPIERGQVYVAVPDRHLLIVDGTVRLGDGPRENMARPAIDALFRSAALSCRSRTVGVLLSGLLNDGASGLSAIKTCGGTAVVQHPLDALADEMPRAALETIEPDEVSTANELGPLLNRLVQSDAGGMVSCPDRVLLEVEIAAGRRLGAEKLRDIADPSALSCPDCGGVLSEIRDAHPLRYRCQIGHAMTAEVIADRAEQVEDAMRVALRVMEERVTLVTRMAEDARRSGRSTVAELYDSRAEEYGRHATILREAATAALRTERVSRPGTP